VGTPSLQREYIDSASEYGWKYVLVDANWDRDWPNYEQEIQALVDYGKAKDPPVHIWLWYNSGGPHNEITESPRDRMHESPARRREFELISSWGVVGVKVCSLSIYSRRRNRYSCVYIGGFLACG